MKDWTYSIDPVGSWYWSGPERNGWRAGVSDHSQSKAPRGKATYNAYVTCRWWIVSVPEEFGTLAEAKAAAFALLLCQRPASADPACRVEVSA